LKEGNQDRLIQMAISKMGHRVFRNVRGMFLTLKTKKKIKAGLMADGSGDLIGFKVVIITPDMVGSKFALFVSIEDKIGKGRPSPQQIKWRDMVLANGGIAGIVWSVEEAVELIEKDVALRDTE